MPHHPSLCFLSQQPLPPSLPPSTSASRCCGAGAMLKAVARVQLILGRSHPAPVERILMARLRSLSSPAVQESNMATLSLPKPANQIQSAWCDTVLRYDVRRRTGSEMSAFVMRTTILHTTMEANCLIILFLFQHKQYDEAVGLHCGM